MKLVTFVAGGQTRWGAVRGDAVIDLNLARAMHLAREPHALRGALAPLFCMGLFHAPLRSKVVSWVMVAFIVGIVALVRQIPQPWRGLIDLGVVAALGMGLVSLAYYTVRALRGHAPNVDPRLPQTPPAP